MTEAVSYINNSLKGLYPTSETGSFARLVMEHVCGLAPHMLLAGKGRDLSDTEKRAIGEIVARLQKFEPIQYILGEAHFYDLAYEVNPSVLIPRPETEELVELIVQDHAGHPGLRLLDIGTGSGCIAIALAKQLDRADVSAVDISTEALAVARRNAEKNNVTVAFREMDILAATNAAPFGHTFDCIVSNPPYVMDSEKTAMKENVLKHEPHLALFVPDEDPLLFYRAIARLGQAWLEKGGHLYFEINAQCGPQTVEMLQQEGYRNIELKRDLSGNNRITKAQR